MRIPSSFRQSRGEGGMMTPLIDVVFLLLIFFICTASFQIAESVLPTSLEAAGSTETDIQVEIDPQLDRVIVKLSLRAGRVTWVVNDRPYASLGEVRSVLKQVALVDNSLPVIVDAEGTVPLGDVIDVYDICRISGFDKIQFAAPV